jgi:serine/threonine-protein kinase
MIDPDRWNELSPLLDEALELEEGQKTAWLQNISAARPEVANALQALLARISSLDKHGFLEANAVAELSREPLVGASVGAYTLQSQLGRGGMGSVWLARRNDGHFEGEVAIKILKTGPLSRTGEERFRREGRVLAKVAHPRIARILDAGVSDGQQYLVLEYVRGVAIDSYCEEQQLSVDARIRLFLDVLAAVGHTHANLIVHRDIKPSNILVTEEGAVKLLDFGIAKLLHDDVQFVSAQGTHDLTRALTPQYAAPEQVLNLPITVATDVYSLGVLLYSLLSGQHPTATKNASTQHYLRSLVEVEPTRLSDAAPSVKLQRAFRGDLDNIVSKALKKDPKERYASVREFAEDLQRYLANEPVLARPDSTSYRVRKFIARHRLPVAIGAIAFAAVVATGVLAVFEGQRAEAERDRALALSSRAEAVANFLYVLITEAPAADKPVTVEEMLSRSQALLKSEYQDSPEDRAAVMAMLAKYCERARATDGGGATCLTAVTGTRVP